MTQGKQSVYILPELINRLDGIAAGRIKDFKNHGAGDDEHRIFLHTTRKFYDPSRWALIQWAIEMYVDCYAPIDTTPRARILHQDRYEYMYDPWYADEPLETTED